MKLHVKSLAQSLVPAKCTVDHCDLVTSEKGRDSSGPSHLLGSCQHVEVGGEGRGASPIPITHCGELLRGKLS